MKADLEKQPRLFKMKFIQVLKLLSKPKLLSKIKNSKSSDTGSPFVKSYKDLMAGGRPTADFYNAEMLNLFWETTPEAIATLLPPPTKTSFKTCGGCVYCILSRDQLQCSVPRIVYPHKSKL